MVETELGVEVDAVPPGPIEVWVWMPSEGLFGVGRTGAGRDETVRVVVTPAEGRVEGELRGRLGLRAQVGLAPAGREVSGAFGRSSVSVRPGPFALGGLPTDRPFTLLFGEEGGLARRRTGPLRAAGGTPIEVGAVEFPLDR